jgi:hypothetical protein
MSTLGELLAAVIDADNEASVHRAALGAADRVLKDAEEALLNAMKDQGVDKVRNAELTVTLVEKSRPQVVDWETFYKVVSKHPELLERRVSAKPFAELLEQRHGKAIPGVEMYVYETLQKRRE